MMLMLKVELFILELKEDPIRFFGARTRSYNNFIQCTIVEAMRRQSFFIHVNARLTQNIKLNPIFHHHH